MAMKSKYDSKCKRCGKQIRKDIDWIEKVDGVWSHQKCPTNGQSANGSSVKHYSMTTSSNRAMSFDNIQDVNDVSDIASAIEKSFETVQKEVKVNFIPSHYQQRIFDFIQYGTGHAVVEAVAGSGKTTTIVNALGLTPSDADVAFVAFNAHIASELKERAPSRVHVSTLHSLGLGNIRKQFPKVKVEKDKVGTILDEIWEVSKAAIKAERITESQRKTNYIKRFAMRKLVSICKSVLPYALFKDIEYKIDMDGAVIKEIEVIRDDGEYRNDVARVIDRYNIEIDADFMNEIVERLPWVMQQCAERTSIVDFDDMIWMPVALEMSLMQFDFLMVDEAQDMNKCQIEFILKSIKSTGRIIAVGDRFQSLYGFRGADTNAIPNIINALNATVLPLSVTYRCPRLHVEAAQLIVPELEARDNAPDGEIVEIDYIKLVSHLRPGDMVICRTNAPLIKPAFECIRNDMKAIIRGTEIGESLIQLVERFETNDLGVFEVSLNQYFEHEFTRFIDKGKEMQALMLQDRVETLRAIMNECNDVVQLMSRIKMLFSDKNEGVVFSSVHRAKGLEADTVFILRPDLLPHPKASHEEDVQQELNCKYVAMTRSKNKLVYVLGDEKNPYGGAK